MIAKSHCKLHVVPYRVIWVGGGKSWELGELEFDARFFPKVSISPLLG